LKAAGELRLTQSAVSQSIALLEDRLRLQLVRHAAPVVELTPAGQRYFEFVQDFSHRLRDGLHERFPVGRTQLRITAPQGLGRLWLAPRLVNFTRSHPRVDLVITLTHRYQAVLGGGVDIALRCPGVEDDQLAAVHLWTDRLVVAGTPDLAAKADGLSPAELVSSFPIIEHPSASWNVWLSGTETVRPALRPTIACSDLHFAIEAAAQGFGLVVAPARIIGSKIATGALRRISSRSVEARPYHAVISRKQFDRAPVREFVAWLSREVALQDAVSNARPSIAH
jgi:DNA-binding transcriptional LysR family regulator